MARYLFILALSIPTVLCGQQIRQVDRSGQQIRQVDRSGLLKMLEYDNDTIYVVNFWATWCSPCVEEIGYFEELRKARAGDPLKIILVNLDFPNQLERRVIPFVKERSIGSTVVNMTDLDYNSWISSVDRSWSGAIPATLIYRGGTRTFIEGEIDRETLFSMVNGIENK